MALSYSNQGTSEQEHLILVNQKNSPLLRLPAELRNRIYSCVFSNETVRVRPLWMQEFYDAPAYTSAVAISLTCRQLHVETSNLFLQKCVFDVSWFRKLNDLVRAMGVEKCNALESIKVDHSVVIRILSAGWRQDSLVFDCVRYLGGLRNVDLRDEGWNEDRFQRKDKLLEHLKKYGNKDLVVYTDV